MNSPSSCRDGSRESGRETMNPAGHHHHRESITDIEQLLTPDQRRPLTVAGHHQFREGISTDPRPFDEVDAALDDDLIEVPWPEVNPPSRRSDKELGRMLDLIDNLPISTNGKDGKAL